VLLFPADNYTNTNFLINAPKGHKIIDRGSLPFAEAEGKPRDVRIYNTPPHPLSPNGEAE